MAVVSFPYGKDKLEYAFEDAQRVTVLKSAVAHYKAAAEERQLVQQALQMPIGSQPLHELAAGKKKVVVLASDHTRPVPSQIIMPAMLREIRRGSPDAEITILIATGCHRGMTKQELLDKFGPDIVSAERIVMHNCDDEANLLNVGTLPSGGQCVLNRLAVEADLLVAEGFIEPHFFAGYSGGRKSVLPGIAGRSTVLANHCSEFIAHPSARTGVLEGNPIHRDMVWAARKAGLRFIVNVVLGEEKQIISAVAGDALAAHEAGVEFLASLCAVKAPRTDAVITTNGGYPLDQNMYQAVKGMTAAEALVKENGVVIMLAQSADGIGGAHFYEQISGAEDISAAYAAFLSRGKEQTQPDQWQSQIMLRVLQHARVIYVSDLDDDTVRAMHMIPAHSIAEAMETAAQLLGKRDFSVAALPDGVGIVVQAQENEKGN